MNYKDGNQQHKYTMFSVGKPKLTWLVVLLLDEVHPFLGTGPESLSYHLWTHSTIVNNPMILVTTDACGFGFRVHCHIYEMSATSAPVC